MSLLHNAVGWSAGHHRPAYETPFEWRFVGGPVVARKMFAGWAVCGCGTFERTPDVKLLFCHTVRGCSGLEFLEKINIITIRFRSFPF